MPAENSKEIHSKQIAMQVIELKTKKHEFIIMSARVYLGI
jgi:hypothetical protein